MDVIYTNITMQIKVNTKVHNCPNTTLSEKIRPASTKWIAATVLDWVREDQTIGASELRRKLQKKFNVVIPYHRVFDGKEMALDLIQGKWITVSTCCIVSKQRWRGHHLGVLLTSIMS